MSVSRIIQLARQRKNITQEQLASALNIPCYLVEQWESGTDTPDWALIPELFEILDLPTESLAGSGLTASRLKET